MVATWVNYGNITLDNATTGESIIQLPGDVLRSEALKFSPDGTKLAAGGGIERPGLVTIWNLNQP